MKSKQKKDDDEESSGLVSGSTELSTLRRRQAGAPQESSLILFEQDEELQSMDKNTSSETTANIDVEKTADELESALKQLEGEGSASSEGDDEFGEFV